MSNSSSSFDDIALLALLAGGGFAAWYWWTNGGSDALDPTSTNNLAYKAASSVTQAVTGGYALTPGDAAYDVLNAGLPATDPLSPHYDPNASSATATTTTAAPASVTTGEPGGGVLGAD